MNNPLVLFNIYYLLNQLKIIEYSKTSFIFENEFIFENFKIKKYLEYLDNYMGFKISAIYE
jgi:hypothetical protein